MKTKIFVLSTCIPEDCKPCFPTVFTSPEAARAGFEEVMREEWQNNAPYGDDGEPLPFPDSPEEANAAMADAGDMWGEYELTPYEIELPEPSESRAVAALRRALPELQGELEQRRDSGNDEAFGELGAIVAEIKATLAGAPPDPILGAMCDRADAAFGHIRALLGTAELSQDDLEEETGEAIDAAQAFLERHWQVEAPEPETEPARPEPPTYGEGANLYIVRELVDAWAIYETRVRADSPEEARKLIKRATWAEIPREPPEYSTLDHTDFEVWATDAAGEMSDCILEIN